MSSTDAARVALFEYANVSLRFSLQQLVTSLFPYYPHSPSFLFCFSGDIDVQVLQEEESILSAFGPPKSALEFAAGVRSSRARVRYVRVQFILTFLRLIVAMLTVLICIFFSSCSVSNPGLSLLSSFNGCHVIV